MAAQLDDVARRGEPLAGLTASEASIYERFGYGTATFTTRWELESHHARMQHAPAPVGRVRIVDAAAAANAAHAVYARIAPTRVGELSRPRSGGPSCSPRRGTDRASSPRCTRTPTVRPMRSRATCSTPTGPTVSPSSTLRVLEVQAVDADAEAAMWSFLFGIDLVGTITAGERPVDDPLRWRLPDPRRLRVRQVRDHLWVRVLDVGDHARGAHVRRRRRTRARAPRRVPTRQLGVLADRRRSRRRHVHAHRPSRRPRGVGRRPRRALPRRGTGVDARGRRSSARAHPRRGGARRSCVPHAPVSLVHHPLLMHSRTRTTRQVERHRASARLRPPRFSPATP